MQIVRGTACLICWVILLAANPARARGRGMTEEQMREAGVGIEPFQINVGVLSPDLGNETFATEGTRRGVNTTFAHKGGEFGFARPILNEVRAATHGFRFKHYGLIGLHFGGMWGSVGGADAEAAHAAGASDFIGGVGGGVRIGMVYTKRYFDLRLVSDLGVRSLWITLDDFEPTTCHTKSGTAYSCAATVSVTQAYIQPRLYLGVNLGRVVSLGGYGGVDISSGVGWLAGGWVAFHIPPWSRDAPTASP